MVEVLRVYTTHHGRNYPPFTKLPGLNLIWKNGSFLTRIDGCAATAIFCHQASFVGNCAVISRPPLSSRATLSPGPTNFPCFLSLMSFVYHSLWQPGYGYQGTSLHPNALPQDQEHVWSHTVSHVFLVSRRSSCLLLCRRKEHVFCPLSLFWPSVSPWA